MSSSIEDVFAFSNIKIAATESSATRNKKGFSPLILRNSNLAPENQNRLQFLQGDLQAAKAKVANLEREIETIQQRREEEDEIHEDVSRHAIETMLHGLAHDCNDVEEACRILMDLINCLLDKSNNENQQAYCAKILFESDGVGILTTAMSRYSDCEEIKKLVFFIFAQLSMHESRSRSVMTKIGIPMLFMECMKKARCAEDYRQYMFSGPLLFWQLSMDDSSRAIVGKDKYIDFVIEATEYCIEDGLGIEDGNKAIVAKVSLIAAGCGYFVEIGKVESVKTKVKTKLRSKNIGRRIRTAEEKFRSIYKNDGSETSHAAQEALEIYSHLLAPPILSADSRTGTLRFCAFFLLSFGSVLACLRWVVV